MAFRLNQRKAIATGLQRVVRKEFRTASDHLTTDALGDEAIHEARKSVKKIRSVLRLLEKQLGSDYRREQRRLREAAHALSSLRDADATAETLHSLRGTYSAVLTDEIARRVERGIKSHKRQAVRHSQNAARRAERALRRAGQSAPRRIRRVGDFKAVRAGLTRGYRRSRRAMDSLSEVSDATQFHAWRRRVKDHFYQVRLFERLHSTPRERAQRLKDLETWLGDDHNHALLRSVLLQHPERFGDARSTALVLGCITRHQTQLRRKALKLGGRLFRAEAGQFRRSVGDWWRKRS